MVAPMMVCSLIADHDDLAELLAPYFLLLLTIVGLSYFVILTGWRCVWARWNEH